MIQFVFGEEDPGVEESNDIPEGKTHCTVGERQFISFEFSVKGFKFLDFLDHKKPSVSQKLGLSAMHGLSFKAR